jgi:hypothetical protein
MVATIVLNQNSLVANGKNSTFLYNFPNSVAFPHHEIAIQSVSMFYSWSNININLGNNVFSMYIPVNASGVAGGGAAQMNTIKVTIPTGQYEVTDLNALIQYYSIQNGFYLINGAGQNVYFLEMLINATRYAVQINTFPVPTSTGWTYNAGTLQWTGNVGTAYAGWTTPLANTASAILGWAGFPSTTVQYNPCLGLPSAFSTLLGYPANTYTIGDPTTYPNGQVLVAPPTISTLDTAGVNRSYLSSIAPQIQPNSSIYFSISNIENKYAIPNSIIYSLNPSVAFGQQINEYPPQFAWNKLLNGTYNNIRLQILGIDFQALTILDPSITIVLVIRDTKDNGLLDVVNRVQGGKG